jgi:5-methylcytosine-specific restriction protein B
MINEDKLRSILSEYKRVFSSFQWPKEKYKWIAVKHFQDNWDINATDFTEMWLRATEKTFNLLTSKNYFPRLMIRDLATSDQDSVRGMFLNLFDETKDLAKRLEAFESAAEDLRQEQGGDKWKQHFQDVNSISTYLWLRYPDKYYIYKYSEARKVAKELESDFVPKKGASTKNLLGSLNIYDEISTHLLEDKELIQIFKMGLTDDCYPDPKLKTMAIDVGYFISRSLPTSEDEWFPTNYTPNISVQTWVGLLKDKTVFTPKSLEIMKRFKDFGGAATCSQLSTKYGESVNFYNAGSTALARRVVRKTGCELITGDTEKARLWPVLFTGKYADGKIEGVYIWKLRDELSQALDEIDMSDVQLFAELEPVRQSEGFWWLNANPAYWNISDYMVGEVQDYSLTNESGYKRRVYQNFLDANIGDPVIGYETSPVKKIVALARIAQKNDGENLYFEILEILESPIELSTFRNNPGLEDMEYFSNPQGSLFKLTKQEYDLLMDIVRKENPITQNEDIESYSKADFLSEVFLDGSSFDDLSALLESKQNVILQGAPGVGKTFAAIRLAYAMMGEKDESRIELIQFHQNYSYEDFVMGYRPQGEGFELKTGIFFRFCQKAIDNPDQKYFFLIDEINRGNISKIFGELLMLIEKDYRDKKVTLAYNGSSFAIPKNIFIIGMMNTADRSLAMIDYALRRRFGFFDFEPAFQSEGFRTYQASLNSETFDSLIELIEELNKDISRDDSLGESFCIGHSYFCNQKPSTCTEDWLRNIISYDIKPVLKEYWFDNANKWKSWETKLLSVFND